MSGPHWSTAHCNMSEWGVCAITQKERRAAQGHCSFTDTQHKHRNDHKHRHWWEPLTEEGELTDPVCFSFLVVFVSWDDDATWTPLVASEWNLSILAAGWGLHIPALRLESSPEKKRPKRKMFPKNKWLPSSQQSSYLNAQTLALSKSMVLSLRDEYQQTELQML